MVGERMAQKHADNVISELAAPPCIHDEWHGDDLTERSPTVGCRTAAINAAKKFHNQVEFKEELVELMETLNIDILQVTEPNAANNIQTTWRSHRSATS